MTSDMGHCRTKFRQLFQKAKTTFCYTYYWFQCHYPSITYLNLLECEMKIMLFKILLQQCQTKFLIVKFNNLTMAPRGEPRGATEERLIRLWQDPDFPGKAFYTVSRQDLKNAMYCHLKSYSSQNFLKSQHTFFCLSVCFFLNVSLQ